MQSTGEKGKDQLKLYHCILIFGFILLCPSLLANKPEKKLKQYKKQNRDRITNIQKGQYDKAIKHFKDYLTKHEHDLESYYGLALAYANLEKPNEAMTSVKLALKHGLDFGRFLAGPRSLTKKLESIPQFKKLAAQHGEELIHGPMVGSLSDRGAQFWLRTWHEVPVKVLVGKKKDFSKVIEFEGKTFADLDYTAVIKADSLKANTTYFYRISLGSQKLDKIYEFKTMPKKGTSAKFDIAFAGGAGYTPQYERMWNTVDQYKFRLLFLLGDNIYHDTPLVKETQQYCYYRRQSRPEYRKMSSYTSLSAIWDDHDYYTNDGHGMNNAPDQKWKIPVWKTFKNNWNNPAYGLADNPGCYFKQSIADVDFFVLDGRYYRYKKTMLGQVQKEWLLEELKASDATFKVLCVNVPITPGVKPGSKDTWDGYAEERDEILDFVADNKIEGFFVIAADRHRSDAWKTERKKGYPIYEFQSSRFTNIHKHPVLKGSLFGYNEKCSFGRLEFDTTQKDPSVRYSIINIDNELIHQMTLKKSQLTQQKVDGLGRHGKN